jgi:hypothetical protein
MMPVTWDPNNKDPSFQLCDGNLLAIPTEADWRSLLTTGRVSPPTKSYWRVKVLWPVNSFAYSGTGLAGAGAPLNTYFSNGSNVGILAYYNGNGGLGTNGGNINNNGNIGNFPAFVSNDYLVASYDADADLVWFASMSGVDGKFNSSWNGDAAGDPSAGTGGIDTSALTAPLIPAGAAYGYGPLLTLDAITALTDASLIGFSPYNGVAATRFHDSVRSVYVAQDSSVLTTWTVDTGGSGGVPTGAFVVGIVGTTNDPLAQNFTVTDNAYGSPNSYQLIPGCHQFNSDAEAQYDIFWCSNVQGNPTQFTATTDGFGGRFNVLGIDIFPGFSGTPDTASSQLRAMDGTTLTSGNFTPASRGELLWGFLTVIGATHPSLGTGWTLGNGDHAPTGPQTAYQLIAGAGPVALTGGIPGNTNYAYAGAVAFTPA